ncbi:hypothetical protein DCC81_24975 [Chitinophaga parva]|uniref:FAS1 domain-containing protein n=2 Tax=Chitinophaga parva TaxID=2169414 RepID=A0A2T7BBU5_9BACT|nr:hypothetical protein DCC81_24975 [Chitinophaga parva]
MTMKKIVYTLLLVISCCMACRQEDAQVTPVGKPIPGAPAPATVKALLDSSNLTIYKAICQRVNLDSILAAQQVAAYTLLVPSDSAFNAAGYTKAGIAGMNINDLDSLVLYHAIANPVNSSNLQQSLGNIAQYSMLTASDFADYSPWSPYRYFLYLGIHQGKLMVNGHAHPLRALDGLDGTIYILDEVLKKPAFDMIDYLGSHAEFSQFLEAYHISDSTNDDYIGYNIQDFLPLLTSSSQCAPFTLIVPTNHAFAQAGLKTPDDFRALAGRSPMDYPNYRDIGGKTYYAAVFNPLDSMLFSTHEDLSYFNRPSYPLVYFSNDFSDNGSLANALLMPGDLYRPPPVYMRLRFQQTGGKLLVNQLSPVFAPVPLTTTDIVCRNGVIHVIDDNLLAH